MRRQQFGSPFCRVQLDIFYLLLNYEKNNFYKRTCFISLVGPSESGKSHLIHDCLVFGIFQPEFDKIYYFYQNFQSLYGLMSKNIKKH